MSAAFAGLPGSIPWDQLADALSEARSAHRNRRAPNCFRPRDKCRDTERRRSPRVPRLMKLAISFQVSGVHLKPGSAFGAGRSGTQNGHTGQTSPCGRLRRVCCVDHRSIFRGRRPKDLKAEKRFASQFLTPTANFPTRHHTLRKCGMMAQPWRFSISTTSRPIAITDL
jgi:hypothetical protein